MEANWYLGFWTPGDLRVIGVKLPSFAMGRGRRDVLVVAVK